MTNLSLPSFTARHGHEKSDDVVVFFLFYVRVSVPHVYERVLYVRLVDQLNRCIAGEHVLRPLRDPMQLAEGCKPEEGK